MVNCTTDEKRDEGHESGKGAKSYLGEKASVAGAPVSRTRLPTCRQRTFPLPGPPLSTRPSLYAFQKRDDDGCGRVVAISSVKGGPLAAPRPALWPRSL